MTCPRCGRPAAVARRQCLYCGAEVAAGAPRDRKAPPRPDAPASPAAIPGPGPPERLLVVVALDGVDPERLPGALGVSPYEAGQCAKAGGYHLQRVAAAADAEAYRERLAAQGITAFTFDETTVRAAANPELAQGGRFDGHALTVRTPGGAIDVAGDDVLLVVKGPITREAPPMESLRWSRTATLEPGFRFHLHRIDQPRPLEIDPAAFDLGAHRAGFSSLLEIAGWVAALAAPVDDGFRRVSPALAPIAPAAVGAPVPLEDALRAGTARPGVTLDNIAQFRFYSAWRGAVERRVRRR